MATVKVIFGDIFDSDADVLVNPVNCVGVMGAGLAKQFKWRFPDMYREYMDMCHGGEYMVGHPVWHFIGQDGVNWVVNFPTKYHWNETSYLDVVIDGLHALNSDLYDRYLPCNEFGKVALPLLGAGLGGLDPVEVMRHTASILSCIPNVDVEIYVHPKDVTAEILGEAERINETEA